MTRYNPSEIEPKWQAVWQDQQSYAVVDDPSKQKMYVSGMFPYPSGAGMHTGHAFSYSIVDAIARFHRAHGKNVLNPMGWDTFGLPAENYAIKTGTAPAVVTKENIANFKKQFKRMGVSIDWTREINTSDPEYYRWTQWIFTKFFERGLAYQKESLQWWCPVDKTVLANEQVEGGKCWRCGTEVVKKSMNQWFFKITDYADALLDEIPDLDWPQKIKTAQTNWIGRSEGAEIEFGIWNVEGGDSLKFTPELSEMIRAGKKTSTIRLEPKNVSVGSSVEFLTRDNDVITSFGAAKITQIRTMPLRDIPNDLAGNDSFRDDDHKLQNFMGHYGDQVTLETEFTIYDFDFIPNSKFQIPNSITVFSTRPDTLFGATFIVIAPEHPLARTLATDEFKESVETYITAAVKKSEIERMNDTREKTGVFTGSYVTNPINGDKIPVWIADYVLAGYGTGAVMAVPAHDERDFAFAEKFNLEVKSVVAPDFGTPLPDANDVTGPVVVGYDPRTKKFMSLINKNNNDARWLVGGGLEEGETYEQAARRELLEEAGFGDIEALLQIGDPTYSYYYNSNKDSNRRSFSYMYLAIIDRNNQIDQQQVENENYEVSWSDLETIRRDWEHDTTGVEHWLETMNRIPGVIRAYEKGESYVPPLYHGEGVLFNSGIFDGKSTSDVREEIVAWLEQQGTGASKTTYKMRDWLISRQRYWGAPIPIIHCPDHGAVAVPEDQLPVVLPEVEDFAPKGDGKSVLAGVTEWVNTTCPTCGKPAKRETDTMDGYACSSWYLLRYADPNNANAAWDPVKANYWSPVDYYVGGDHAVAHLLYVRFWTHVFADMGLVDFKEPVKKLVYHGYINAEDGTKMSKSKGNVIDPLDVIDQGYGADALRTYLLFMGPIELDAPWDSRGIAGIYRFLNRVWTLTQEFQESDKAFMGNDEAVVRIQHKTVRKATDDYHRLSFNTAISALMEYVNELYKLKVDGFSGEVWRESLSTLTRLIAPFAPHMAEELWQQLGHDGLIHEAGWPLWDDSLITTDTMTIIVQVNGKLRAKLVIDKTADEEVVKSQALDDPNVQKFTDNKKPAKVIYVPGRLVNIVI